MNDIEKRVIAGLKEMRNALFVWAVIQVIFMLMDGITTATAIILLIFMLGWALLYQFIRGYEST